MFYMILAANVSHQTLTTCEWLSNTQPHIHSISSLVRMFRTMMIQERDGALYLLQGTPRRWLDQGQAVRIREAPTWYGPLSLECVSNVREGKVQVQFQVPPRLGDVPMRVCLRLPKGLRIASVTLGGRPGHHVPVVADVQGEWINLRGLQGRVDLTVHTEVDAQSKLQ
jgi:hypothetical protein